MLSESSSNDTFIKELRDNSAEHQTRQQGNNSEPDDTAPVGQEDDSLKIPLVTTEEHNI